MATFEVERDGKRYEVEAPDLASASRIVNKYVGRHPAPPKPGILEDMGRTAMSAIAESGNRMWGLGGDLELLVQQGGNAIDNAVRGMIGAEPAPEPWGDTFLPTSRDIGEMTGFEGGGPSLKYEPQTIPGKIIEEPIKLALPSLLMGPAGSAGQAARTVSKFGVIPGLAGQGAGQAAELFGASPETAESIKGGVEMAATAGAAGMSRPPITGMSLERIGAEKQLLYGAAKARGVTVSRQAFNNLSNEVARATGLGRPEELNAPQTMAMVKRMTQGRRVGAPYTLDELDEYRKAFNTIARESDVPNERRVASEARRTIDMAIANLTDTDLIAASAGDAAAASAIRKEAQRMAHTEAKASIIEDTMRDAELSASWQSGNKAAGLRNAFASLAKNDRLMRTFSPEERRAIESVARNDSVERSMAAIGGLANRLRAGGAVGGGLAVGFGTGSPAAGLAAGVGSELALEGVRAGARGVANASKVRRAEDVSGMVRGGTRPPWTAARRLPAMLGYEMNMSTTPPPRQDGWR